MADDLEPHVKITMSMMYAEQQQTNKMLAQAVTHLENLADLPERVRSLELASVEQKTTIKDIKAALAIAKGAMVSAGIGVFLALVNMFAK